MLVLRSFPLTLLAIAALGLLAGCSKSDPTSLTCQVTPKAVAVGDTTPLGFSAADVLATMGGMRTSGLAWARGSKLYVAEMQASTQTHVTLAFADAPVSATFVESVGGGCGPGLTACVECQSSLEIALPLHLSTDDGALVAVDMNVTLSAAPTVAGPPTASFSTDVPASSVAGTYFNEIPPMVGSAISGLHVEAAWGDTFPSSGTVVFAGDGMVVPNAWNGFFAAVLQPQDPTQQATWFSQGYFPPAAAPSL